MSHAGVAVAKQPPAYLAAYILFCRKHMNPIPAPPCTFLYSSSHLRGWTKRPPHPDAPWVGEARFTARSSGALGHILGPRRAPSPRAPPRRRRGGRPPAARASAAPARRPPLAAPAAPPRPPGRPRPRGACPRRSRGCALVGACERCLESLFTLHTGTANARWQQQQAGSMCSDMACTYAAGQTADTHVAELQGPSCERAGRRRQPPCCSHLQPIQNSGPPDHGPEAVAAIQLQQQRAVSPRVHLHTRLTSASSAAA